MIPQERAYRFVRLKQSKARSLDGLRVGQIGFVEELDDSLSVFMRNLHSGGAVTNAATGLAGVPIAWLECAFKGWLPIHAAAALHWKPDAIVMLLKKMKKDTIRKDLAAKVKGTGGMSAIHFLHVYQCGTQRVEEALLSRMDAVPRWVGREFFIQTRSSTPRAPQARSRRSSPLGWESISIRHHLGPALRPCRRYPRASRRWLAATN